MKQPRQHYTRMCQAPNCHVVIYKTRARGWYRPIRREGFCAMHRPSKRWDARKTALEAA